MAMASAITDEQPGISSTKATEIATRMATTTPPPQGAGGPRGAGGPGGPRGAGGPPPPPPSDVSATDETDDASATSDTDGTSSTAQTLIEKLAELLGMSQKDILNSLGQGTSLSQLAASHGVSSSDLLDTVTSALKGSGSKIVSQTAAAIASELVSSSLAPGSLVSQSA